MLAIAFAYGSSLAAASLVGAAPIAEKETDAMESIAGGRWRFGGELGRRVEANAAEWLVRAPDANPGLLEMFRQRDRHLPYATPVPWAGEFAGKYLTSAVQALSMTDDTALHDFVPRFVTALVESQDEDGYLGPWPKDERLLGHWDLWGHYHCMLGLLFWHDRTGDQSAFDCVTRAADLMCAIYVDGDRRPIDAGTPQINLAVLHVMGDLYRRTGNPRYRALMQRIEEDMEKDGDWLRLGAEDVPYYKLPGGGARWESLHIVQAFRDLYLITGEERYKDALANLWRSIVQYDRHPSGAFSTHEQALGTVFAKGSIETCCSVAWLALSVDMLRLTGDPAVADELELSTWNQVLAAQHPSGSWCTYDNPIDGTRAPSYHQINFQYRPGTPELNCCSVNAPRGLGMLPDWAVMEGDNKLIVNFYGPGTYEVTRATGQKVTLTQETEYPLDGKVAIRIDVDREEEFALWFRIPAWSKLLDAHVNGFWSGPLGSPGSYQNVSSTWKSGDVLTLIFDMPVRSWNGGPPDRVGATALYRGPLLLAFDTFYNDIERADLPAIDMAKVTLERVPVASSERPGIYPAMGLWQTTAADGQAVTLCDFASGGAHGTEFVGWLPSANPLPCAVPLLLPEDKAAGAPGPVLFRWGAYTGSSDTFELVVARDPELKDVVIQHGASGSHAVIEEKLADDGVYYWTVRSTNENGSVTSPDGPRTLRVDSGMATAFTAGIDDDGLMAASALDGTGDPLFGTCDVAEGLAPAPDRNGNAGKAVAFDGKSSTLRYRLPFLPEDDYTFLAWVCPDGLPVSGIQQVFSAWHAGMDDPLRVTLAEDKVHARMEAGSGFGTKGVQLQNGQWTHVAAVKQGSSLTLYVDGKAADMVAVPERVGTRSEAIGIGYNPRHTNGERFVGRIDDFAFYARALTPDEVAAACQAK
ncbi:MAG: hypothetical protein GY851_16375 [bacterium]|nr:hypothetical protein [bacterium]